MSSSRRAFTTRLAAETLAATATSVLALAVLARREGRGALQPLNATSHWLNGAAVAQETTFAWRTTGVGLATHLAATGFWAALYESWLSRGDSSWADGLGKAAVMAGISALVDYRATPKRFTPGWEFVLTPLSMGAVYAALGAGLAAGSIGTSSAPGRLARKQARR